MNRVGKRQRRVREAESRLAVERDGFRTRLTLLREHAREAATPGRVVGAGVLAGALAGLAGGRRRSATAAPPQPGPGLKGWLDGVQSASRLLSLLMPVLLPLIQRWSGAQDAGDGEQPHAPGADPPDADLD